MSINLHKKHERWIWDHEKTQKIRYSSVKDFKVAIFDPKHKDWEMDDHPYFNFSWFVEQVKTVHKEIPIFALFAILKNKPNVKLMESMNLEDIHKYCDEITYMTDDSK